MHRLQSAMEYLMTYGWAILVIAVVLGVLYSLGIFSPSNFAPKASPGSCQVFRPNGPGTGYDVNLEGTCSGELPEYVAEFGVLQDYISVPDSQTIEFAGDNSITMSSWVYLTNYTNDRAVVAEHLCQYYFTVDSSGHLSLFFYGVGGYYTSANVIPLNEWEYIAATYNGVSLNLYLNGQLNKSYAVSGTITYCNPPYNRVLDIGYESNSSRQLHGKISNLQIYNTSLDANLINAMYQEGMGGAPIDLQHIVGWWPLNGNANDYSGNNNDGVPTNVLFTGSWQSGYTAP